MSRQVAIENFRVIWMARVQLIHGNDGEALRCAKRLESAGHEVVCAALRGLELIRGASENPPEAFVIDLSRSFSYTRDMALALRQNRFTRSVPIVFVEGEPEKVVRLKSLLPDATYTSWSRVRSALKHAMANPPSDPVFHKSSLAGYSGTPLPKKLGIKVGSVVALVAAPDDFRETLGELPEGAAVHDRLRRSCDLIVWFNRSRKELDRGIAKMAAAIFEKGSMWIAWPKKASALATDLSEPVVRETGLASGLVDYKVCAIDATWSGLLFTRRKADRAK